MFYLKAHELFLMLFCKSLVSSLKLSLPLNKPINKVRPLLQSTISKTKRKFRQLDVQEEAARKEVRMKVPLLFELNGAPQNSSNSIGTFMCSNGTIPFAYDIQGERKNIATITGIGSMSDKLLQTKAKTLNLVTDVHELRRKVLDENVPLSHCNVKLDVADASPADLLNHSVVELIVRRYHEQSTPGYRSTDDNAVLALSLEGGGMRGAVSAGMAAAIATLGLSDCFDRIYGSSAGSVIGAYMVSRQMCMDVYVDILPAAKRKFVCTKRMFSALAVTAFDWALSHSPLKNFQLPKFANIVNPGMNISFVLDGIMDHNNGIRPLDINRFLENDRKQPLRVASSYAKDGKLFTKCFGTYNFYASHQSAAKRGDGLREGIYACLEASMTVPGATGPPVLIVDYESGNRTLPFFDAFCFEPLPYRSAVDEGATHVLVLCSRPEGFQPVTIQGVYERAIAPLYFRSHGEPEVANFFEQGGQQYIYSEDLLLLEEGKRSGMKTGNGKPVMVPPPRVIFGVKRDEEIQMLISNRQSWKTAHLLPLKVPVGTPELKTLEQGRDEVLEAVRGGFAAAFDLLAPAIDLQLANSMTGMDVAKMVFPSESRFAGNVLDDQIRVLGDEIVRKVEAVPPPLVPSRKTDGVRCALQNARSQLRRRLRRKHVDPFDFASDLIPLPHEASDHAGQILNMLPGFSSGRMAHLAANLRQQ